MYTHILLKGHRGGGKSKSGAWKPWQLQNAEGLVLCSCKIVGGEKKAIERKGKSFALAALSKVRPFAAAGIPVFVWSKSVPASSRERAIAVRFGIAMIHKDPSFFARIYGEMYVSQL